MKESEQQASKSWMESMGWEWLSFDKQFYKAIPGLKQMQNGKYPLVGNYINAEAALALYRTTQAQLTEARLKGRLEVCEAVLSASDDPKNKGFTGTWHGDMAAACGEVAKQYKTATKELKQLTGDHNDGK